MFQLRISFVTVIFLIMLKARCSSYTMAFKIKVIAEAEAVENSTEIAWDYGLSKFMVWHWRRDQATILSGQLKMSARCAKMGRFAPKCLKLDEQATEWFHSRETKHFICNVKWDEFLLSWVRLSFNAWEAKNLIGGRKYVVVMTVIRHVT